jgi:hypothetical protein
MDSSPEYEAFVNKFRPKKTTDDCMTPDAVYSAVRDWAASEYGLEGREIVRPFRPGGEYRSYDYPDGCVVLDNPPFSIVTRIVRFYNTYGLDYFLFAPHLTNFNIRDTNHVIVAADIVYENGAKVVTSFVTNLGDFVISTPPGLYRAISEAQKNEKPAKNVMSYDFPDEICTSASLGNFAENGVDFRVGADECKWVSNPDGMASIGKKLFGAGFLLSRTKANAKAKAKANAKAKAKANAKAKAVAVVIRLSDGERAIVDSLGRKAGGNGEGK